MLIAIGFKAFDLSSILDEREGAALVAGNFSSP